MHEHICKLLVGTGGVAKLLHLLGQHGQRQNHKALPQGGATPSTLTGCREGLRQLPEREDSVDLAGTPPCAAHYTTPHPDLSAGRGLGEEGKGVARWESEEPVTSSCCCSYDSSGGGRRMRESDKERKP